LASSNKKSVIHVLHVDDDPSLQEITKLMLLDLDSSFEIDKACCVDEAFKKLSTEQYDVVVSDYEMPQKTGLQFLAELREQNNQIPLILFTGKGREEVAIRALNLGADGYINKQGDPETVYGKLSHSVKQCFARRNIEKLLTESEKRSKAIVDHSPIGIATSGVDKHFLSANEAFCKIIGYTEGELRSLTFKDITYPADLKESTIKMEELENAILSSFVLEKRYVKKDETVINGKIMVSAVRNQNGKPDLFIAELEDITEHKKTEEHQKVLERKLDEYSKHLKCMVDLRTVQLKDANERLVKSERLAAIGELAGMVGHDLRNPLAGIKNATYFLKKKGTSISEAQTKEILETIDKAIDHSDKIINDLLDYGREMHLELTKHSTHNLVDEALRMVQVPNRIQIINHVDEEAWIWVNADKMMRVFINLIKNAVDAMPQKGSLIIRSCQTKDCVEIGFADTGTGIPEETLKKLFTPLFTTKAQGMGFGLAICKRIIEAHEGTITVKTAVNKGTKLTVTLPIKPNAKVEGEKTCASMIGE
jgi:PAS domain S-box-containing protein